ncbi:MAG TPA: helix-turn-helix domain-containing protein [Dehalococcoidia bacterium]|nr:helix-turn-helix domain-containing protein [Dehalococcoidia bacterium]
MTGPRPPEADGDDGDGGALGSAASDAVAPDSDGPGSDVDDVTLGTLLLEARRARALTLADAERDTRINRDYLEALEREQYELLPAPVYARGFLRAYARHLGLDEDAAMSLLPADLPSPQGLEPIAGLRRGSGLGLPMLNLPVIAAVLAVVVIVAAAAFAFTRLGGGDESGIPAIQPPTSASPVASETPTTDAAASATASAAVPPFDVGETPNFIGVDLATAEALLTQLGLRFIVIEVEKSDVVVGEVFAQAPDPGAAITSDDDVTLIVSKASE